MTKAFWQGFREGFLRASKYGIPIAIALVAGLALGSYSHPYEKCKRMYETPEDISECIGNVNSPTKWLEVRNGEFVENMDE